MYTIYFFLNVSLFRKSFLLTAHVKRVSLIVPYAYPGTSTPRYGPSLVFFGIVISVKTPSPAPGMVDFLIENPGGVVEKA